MSESNNIITKNLIKNMITDTIIITTIWCSLSNNTHKILFRGVIAIYILNKYI